MTHLYYESFETFEPVNSNSEPIQIGLLPPFAKNCAPIMLGNFDTGPPNKSGGVYHMFDFDGFVSKMLSHYHAGGYPNATLYIDEIGNIAFRHGHYDMGGGSTWYRLTPHGFDTLFEEWYIMGFADENEEGANTHCDGIEKYIKDYEEQQAWLKEQSTQALARHGFVGNIKAITDELCFLHDSPSETQPDPSTDGTYANFFIHGGAYYNLGHPQTWEEYETALIDAMCDYAKSIGQWNG